MEAVLGRFRRHKLGAKPTVQIVSIPHRPVKGSRTAVKADPDTDTPSERLAAARGEWLAKILGCRLSTLVWGGIEGLVLLWCIQNGLPVIGKGARQASHPLFNLGDWDGLQKDLNLLHSSIRSEQFSNSEQIQASVEQGQIAMHQCRFLIEDASKDLGTVVMGHIQEWVFDGKCTLALPVAVRRSCGKTQRVLDCINNTNFTLTNAMHQIQEARSGDGKILTGILGRHSSPFSRASPEHIASDNESLGALRESLSNLTLVQSHLRVIIESYQLERKRLIRLHGDTSRLDHLCHRYQEGAISVEGWTQEESQISVWDCQDLDTLGLRDSFLSLASAVIGDDEKIRQFQSRYHSTFIV